MVGMKPLSERDENPRQNQTPGPLLLLVGMKPLSERDENKKGKYYLPFLK